MNGDPNLPSPACQHCGRETYSHIVDVALWQGRRLVVIEDVPAQVCDACGEQFYDEATTEALYRLVSDGLPTSEAVRELTVPVFSLGQRQAVWGGTGAIVANAADSLV